MKYSNEIKVGATLIVATLIFILGVRYFEDLPLFTPTYELRAEFDNAGGLISGNVVRVNGVTIGSVNSVKISPTSGLVLVGFHIDNSIVVTEGTYATIGGFDALGAVRMDLFPGPMSAPVIPEGGMIEGRAPADLLTTMAGRAPEMVDKVDAVLSGLDSVLGETNTMLKSPDSDLRMTLQSVQGAVDALEAVLESERDRIGRVLANMESVTGDLDTAAGEDGEKLAALMENLSATLEEVDGTLVEVKTMSTELTQVLQALNSGEGTLGRLLNDPSMYEKMDSTLNGLNALMADFQTNPGRYLKEMRIVDLF